MKRFFLVPMVLLFASALASIPLHAQPGWEATIKDYHGLVEIWQARVYSETFPEFVSLISVHSDGTWSWYLPTVALDGVSADSRVAGVGPWKRTGARTYHMTAC